MKSILFTIVSCFTLSVYAQSGTITGVVVDDQDNQTIIGATAIVRSKMAGSSTDFDGNFSIRIAEGTYDVEISFISYQPIFINGVVVKAGESINIGTARMKSATVDVGEVVIQVQGSRKNEQAMNRIKSNSVAMMDGISSEKLALTGDGNAAEAAKRVTGVSIEGGKYIYVRGLGDRYSKVTLNGMDIPGLDPDKNSLQMDIFPSNLIDNILVSKNFTADMPADFAGGVLNVETKAFPEEETMRASIGLGYNPSMHFNSNYLSYDGSSTDALGFDNGQREIPSSGFQGYTPTPNNGATDDEINSFVGSFDPTLGASRNTSLLDYSLGFSYGNQIDLKDRKDTSNYTGNKLGYVFSLSYKTDYTYYDEVEYSEYQKATESNVYEMINANTQTGELGEKNVLVGIMGGLAYKTNSSKYRLSLLRLQNGTNKAGKFNIENNPLGVGQSGFSATSDNLEYNERSLTNVIINGTHVLSNKDWEVDWRVSPTLSTSDDPDIRKTAFTTSDNGFQLSPGDGGLPSRIWRNLLEVNLSAKTDLTKKYKLFNEKAKLKFGVSYTAKARDYEILGYDMQLRSTLRQQWDGNDANQILDASNIHPNRPNGVHYLAANRQVNSNAYESSIQNIGVYISNEFSVTPNLKAVAGVRAEQYTQWHTGRDIAGAAGDPNGNVLDNEKVLESLDFFPSLNLIYTVKEQQNLRFAYARTIARPSFKELSFAQIIDPLTNRIFNGSLFQYDDWDGKLVQTNIDNIDLRWEKFMERGQILSASAFFKNFENPIELVRIPQQLTTSEFQPRNVGNGRIFGIELEATHGLDFISENFKNWSVSGNVTLVKSRVDMTVREYDARKIFEKDGETIERTRQMAGQAPYVVNFGLSYKNVEQGLTAGIFYNVKGPALEIVGSGRFPDIYQEPFHSLNLGINKKIGEEQKTIVDLKVSNLLNDRRESFYQSYSAKDQIFSSINPGMTISIGLSHKF